MTGYGRSSYSDNQPRMTLASLELTTKSELRLRSGCSHRYTTVPFPLSVTKLPSAPTA